eukprot:9496757-Pyramimonas_sp.AAC.1
MEESSVFQIASPIVVGDAPPYPQEPPDAEVPRAPVKKKPDAADMEVPDTPGPTQMWGSMVEEVPYHEMMSPTQPMDRTQMEQIHGPESITHGPSPPRKLQRLEGYEQEDI